MFGVYVRPGATSYAFTHGTCASESANEDVEITYDSQTNSFGNPTLYNMGQAEDYSFGVNYTQPITLSRWAVSSQKAFDIFSSHDGPKDFQDIRALLLRQSGDHPVWEGNYAHGSIIHTISIDATTGEVTSSRTIDLTQLRI